VSEEILCVKFSETLLTLPISALCYCTVFSVTVNVEVPLFQLLPSTQFCPFQHSTPCCNVQIHIQSADSVVLGTLQGFLGSFAKLPDSDR